MIASSLISALFSVMLLSFNGGTYEVGSRVEGFSLKNVDGRIVSLADFPDAKGFVVIFTCNHCPYAQAYQDRIIAIDKAFKDKGYPVIAINPVSAEDEPLDSYENMIVRAQEKVFTFPYLHDADQDVLMKFGAERTPTAFVLQKSANGDLLVEYIGAIDDNYQDPSAVKVKYVENALNSLLSGVKPEPSFTRAIGCGIPYRDGPVAVK